MGNKAKTSWFLQIFDNSKGTGCILYVVVGWLAGSMPVPLKFRVLTIDP